MLTRGGPGRAGQPDRAGWPVGLAVAWPVLVFVRSRGGARAVGVLAATALAGALVQPEPVPVKLRLVAVGLGPLVAALPGVFLPTLLERPERQLEPSRSARLVALRLGWLGVLLVAGTLVGQVAVGGPGAWLISARSVALVGGLGLITAQVVPALVAWLPGALLVATTFVYGTASMSGRPYGWALVLQPERSVRSGVVAAVLLLTGAAAYVWRDGRSA